MEPWEVPEPGGGDLLCQNWGGGGGGLREQKKERVVSQWFPVKRKPKGTLKQHLNGLWEQGEPLQNAAT